eukprot:m.94939 g.94939  ORF g.94939 m.94939 type:complete len:298 (+) comp26771_c0_seq1:66-959(+)
MAEDELFEVRNALHIGAFQTCISDAGKLKVSSDFENEKSVLVYRAMISQGKFKSVVVEIEDDVSSDLLAIKRLARYMQGKSNKKACVDESKKLQEDGISMSNAVVALVSGMIFYNEEMYDEALRCVKSELLKDNESLETIALTIQIYLAMHRVDRASKELKYMKTTLNEDATLTQLAGAWVNLAKGGESIQEAFYVFEELAQKYGDTPLLLNGQAAACLMQGKHEDAEALLQTAEALDGNNADTLINTAVCAGFMGKSIEIAQRSLVTLSENHPTHPFSVDLAAKEDEFEEYAAKFQ